MLLTLGACRSDPRPPAPANALLAIEPGGPTHPSVSGVVEGSTDPRSWETDVVARVREVKLFGQTEAKDVTTYWTLVVCDVLEVRRGRFGERELRFVNKQRWVQAGYKNYEYGPRIDYDAGWTFVFGLASAQPVPKIVSQTRLILKPAAHRSPP